MATVYLAEDVRHHRKVALKVLRPELAAVIGADRFLKEIEVTANLQHPHILPLHDSGAAGSFLFYVMPYVEGESLRTRLERERQLSVAEAVELARQTASALDYAHRHGVIHRDIKPENILIHDRQALIADFGIALAVSTAGGSRMTETGMSLGTPHYMSPEQAMGDRAVDARSDVYALGCVLYEMLVGEPPFTGPTAQAIVAKVITEKPPLVTAARETTPPHLAAAIQKSLAKLPADRFASAAEFADALTNPSFTYVTAASLPTAALPHRRTAALPWLLAAALAAVAFWLGGKLLAPASQAPPPLRTSLSLDAVQARDGGGVPLAFSPDGSRLVFSGRESSGPFKLYLRDLNNPTPVPLAGTDGAIQPFFSPDGQWIGFFQEGKLRKMALAGGAVATIADLPQLQGASWGTDGKIVGSSRGRLFQVSASGGTPEVLAAPDSSSPGGLQGYRFPELLPNGRAVVFTLIRGPGDPVLAVLSLDDHKVTELDQPGMSPHYVEGGTLVFTQNDSTVFAAPFDAERARFSGPPQPVFEGVRIGPASVAKMSVSRSGGIAYLEGRAGRGRELILMDEGGRLEVLPLEPNSYVAPAFSPDGRQLLFAIGYGGPPFFSDLWSWDVARRILTRLTFDSASGGARWTPDGRRIVYGRRMSASQYGIFWMAPDGSGRGDTLVARPGIYVGGRITSDGRRMVFMERTGPSPASANWDIWITPVDSSAAARPLLNNRFNELSPEVSPDGNWLAYMSDETGENVIYVRRLSEGGGRLRVSSGGGSLPQWSPQGRELFYRNGDSIYVVPVAYGKELTLGSPKVRFVLPNPAADFDIHPDGHHVVFVRPPTVESQTIQVILNRFARR